MTNVHKLLKVFPIIDVVLKPPIITKVYTATAAMIATAREVRGDKPLGLIGPSIRRAVGARSAVDKLYVTR